jgi:uncharacterized protein (DUF983 family)
MSEQEERLLWSAISNGIRCRCPRCGKGKLFRSYLKVANHCEYCGLDFTHHRADDLPAYIAITIVGHILVVGLVHFQMVGAEIAPMGLLALLVLLAIVLPLAMLPSIKGAVVGLQWAQRMHGF